MHWYEGGISEAITKSKSKGAIFVVYIEGNDEKSQQITQVIDDPEISQTLESEAFVAIKIEANSLSHQQFSQIYKETPVPSIYFLGKNGSPLDVITEANTVQVLSTKIQAILEKADIKLSAAKQSENLIKSEQTTTTTRPPANVVCENGVCTIQAASSEANTSKQLTTEEKVERAKELLEKKRLEKEQEEKENERLKEIERRKMGQNVQKLKKWQEDEDLKKILEEREKEKRESLEAKNRVLAQIAQDKAERAAKFASTTNQQQQQPKISSQSKPTTSTTNSNIARLQFKLPDGRSRTNDFSSLDTLQVVHNFIRQENLNLTFRNYMLATTFPRREFNEQDNSQSLLDLELVPTAVLLVLPVNRGTVATNTGGIGGGFAAMLWSLFAPILTVFNYLKSFVFGQQSENRSGNSSSNNSNKRPAENPSTSSATREYKRRAGETSVVRRQGNVHRLTDKRDSDDENNTWNGNSTQQM